MIRINILNGSQGQVSDTNVNEENIGISSEGDIAADDMAVLRSQAIKNIIIILITPLGLFFYQYDTIPKLQETRNKIQKEVNEVRDKNISAANSVDEIKKLKKQKEELQVQVGAIEVLKKDRYQLVKVLELIQKQLPMNMWLQEINFANSQLNVVVYSVSTNEELQFLDALSKSIYFKEVRLIRSMEFNSNQFGDIKKVEISCVFGEVSS